MTTLEFVMDFAQHRNKELATDFVHLEPTALTDLIDLSMSSLAYPVPEYASWMLTHVCALSKDQVAGRIEEMFSFLEGCKNHSVQRNLIKTLSIIGLNGYFDCFDFLLGVIANRENKVASQVYAMQCLQEICHELPELSSEVLDTVEHYREGKSAAYFSAERALIKRLK